MPWWEGASVYEAYLPSIRGPAHRAGGGVLARLVGLLDYFNDGTPCSLGVDAIYLSPQYPSSGYDGGYDIEDHASLAVWAGTHIDFSRFINEAHERGVKVILDFVANHTSCRHRWFEESQRAEAGAYDDWYWWSPGRLSEPPNNWTSVFPPVGSAWTFSETKGQYYLHSFLPQQPDLNWRNPRVRAAMLDIMGLWLRRGVDGFRVDATHRLGKDPELED